MNKYKYLTGILIGIFCFVILTVCAIEKKQNFHIDEIYSYGLANHAWGRNLKIEDGTIYTKEKNPYKEYVSVSKENRFKYENVYLNQKNDVHPPLYYYILHTISSLFVGSFSKMYAGSINIFFSVLTIMLSYKISILLYDKKEIAFITSMYISISAGFIQANTFLRMYLMAMFIVTASAYLHILFIKKRISTNKFLLSLFLISLLGALTHYYIIVFMFFEGIIFTFIMLLRKNIRIVFYYFISIMIAAIHAIGIFPPMLAHIFKTGEGGRGEQSFDNLIKGSDYLENLTYFGKTISQDLFGTAYGLLLIVAILFTLLLIKKIKQRNEQNIIDASWYFLFFSSILYFFMISKIAVYLTDRYIVPIYSIVIVLFLGVTLKSVYLISENIKKKRLLLIFVFLVSILGVGYKNCNWNYNYINQSNRVTYAKNNNRKTGIILYKDLWKCTQLYYEVCEFNSLIFINEKNIGLINLFDCKDASEMLIYLDANINELVLEEIIFHSTKLTKIDEIIESDSFGYHKLFKLKFNDFARSSETA